VAVGSTLAMAHALTTPVPTTRRRVTRAGLSPIGPAPIRLSVSLTWWDRRSVVLMEGDLDVETTIALESAFDQLIGSGFDEVVLDVSQLRHVDEAGAVVLAELWAQLRNEGIICRVRGLPPEFSGSPFELLMFVRNVDPVSNTHNTSLLIRAD
jgi:anti-anti-sigma regulatory factor